MSLVYAVEGDDKSFKDFANNVDGLKEAMNATVKESEQLKKSLINWSAGIQAINAVADVVDKVSSAFSAMSDKMKSVQQENLLTSQLTGKTGEEMEKLRNAVKATADHFGEDFGDTMRAVNSLAKGFGITAEEALQLVRDGFVSGANANGEFVDTLKEYPRYFKEAGLSAEQFVAITTNAAKQGIYSDKGVDVIKEGNLRIREMTKATADAMNAIGISAEKVQEDLANGSLTTFDVMQMVAAKLNELPASSAAVGTAIADIFGGPGEDAGLEYIRTLATVQTSMSEVKAAAGEMAIQQEQQIATQENLKNSFLGLVDVAAIYTNVQPYVDLAAQAGMAAMGIGGLIKTIKAMNVQQAIAKTRIVAVTVAQKAATIATTAWTAGQKVLNWVLKANPIGLIITAIGLLVAAVVKAYNEFDGFRAICDKVWGAVSPLANVIMDGLATAFEWLVEKVKEAWEWLSKILDLGGKKVNVAVNVTKPKKPAPKIDTSGGGRTTPDPSAYQYTPVVDMSAINTEIASLQNVGDTASASAQEVVTAEGEKIKAFNASAVTLGDIENNISILREQLLGADLTNAEGINKQISQWQAMADAIRNAGKQAKETGNNIRTANNDSQKTTISVGDAFRKEYGAIKGLGGGVTQLTDALKNNGDAWQMVTGVVDGFLSIYDSISSIIGIIEQITAAVSAASATTVATSAANTTAKTAETNANVTAAVSGALSAHSGIPFVGIALGLAAVGAILAAMSAIPKFAHGGIVSGPTLAMVGEYGGASNNPEVIAPLNKLRSMLAPQGIDLSKIVFEIKGRTLVGILAKETNLIRRS